MSNVNLDANLDANAKLWGLAELKHPEELYQGKQMGILDGVPVIGIIRGHLVKETHGEYMARHRKGESIKDIAEREGLASTLC